MQALTQAVKEKARQLGFVHVGVTNPEPPMHYQTYVDWLAAGRHGEMGYLATEQAQIRRANPREILPECRSILVLGVPYSPQREGTHSQQASAARSLSGKVAAYAWGDDYHHVLVERMRQLVSYIESQVGKSVPNRWYTDTGPLLERELAQRAGLGWIGKNTCLINPQHGSYFFLAEILLGIALVSDTPFTPDHCGTCTRCIDACPTNCILPDRTLDARRCVSYLTIEVKGEIPTGLRPLLQDWIFGCDVCQQVCPWNQRFARSNGDPAFAPRVNLPAPDLLHEIELTPEAFNRKFKDNPVKRTKRRGYLRNIAIALGNHQDKTAVFNLAHSLQSDDEVLVRQHAAWALGQIGGGHARKALTEAKKKESDPAVKREIDHALKRLET